MKIKKKSVFKSGPRKSVTLIIINDQINNSSKGFHRELITFVLPPLLEHVIFFSISTIA
jgi:hypothetical protein